MYATIIASRARIRLYKAIEEVTKNEGRVYYYDTDSIFAGFKKKVIGEQHGEIV